MIISAKKENMRFTQRLSKTHIRNQKCHVLQMHFLLIDDWPIVCW